jgi:hypothetical protein
MDRDGYPELPPLPWRHIPVCLGIPRDDPSYLFYPRVSRSTSGQPGEPRGISRVTRVHSPGDNLP